MRDGPLRPTAKTEPRSRSQVKHYSSSMEAENKTINHYARNPIFFFFGLSSQPSDFLPSALHK